jgi:hypothetical protein
MANVILREDEDLTLATLRDRVEASWVVALCSRNDTDPAQHSRPVAAAAEAGDVRGDVPADELAAFCVWGLTGAAVHSSKAAARRLVTVTMDGLRSPR